MFGIGLQELIVVLIIILVLFGGKKLPELSKSLGQAIREFRKEVSKLDVEDKKETKKKSGHKSTE